MYKKVPFVFFSCLILAAVVTACDTIKVNNNSGTLQSSGDIVPENIPAGYNFPANRADLQAIADSYDHKRAREHAWDIWAGMTSPSTVEFNGQILPIWETWCGSEEVFGTTECMNLTKPSRIFEKPKQHTHTQTNEANTQVVSFNKFNPAMAGYLDSSHAGPGSKNYDYWLKNSIVTLNSNWPKNTSTADRKVVETPYVKSSAYKQGVAAMELKPVFYLVKAGSQLTPVPFWQGPSASTKPSVPIPQTWTTCVLFDPSQTIWSSSFKLRAATAEEINNIISGKLNLDCTVADYQYSPLGQIHYFELDASAASAWNTVTQTSPDGTQGLTAASGDYAVLVGMHVNTKELINWTWQTFWWQSGQDTPAGEPGSGVGPGNNVKNQWTNYAMCANYKQTKNSNGDMDICYNPYLETAFGVAGGLKSNCMSCHGQAIAGSNSSYPSSFDKPIKFNHGKYYQNGTTTDFSWALQGNNTGS